MPTHTPDDTAEERWLSASPLRWETDTSRHGTRFVRLALDVDEVGPMVCYLVRNWQVAALAGCELGGAAGADEGIDPAAVLAYFHFDQRLEARVEPDDLWGWPGRPPRLAQRITGLRTPPKG